MNEATKQLFAKLYLEKATSEDYIDWAIACLEDGFDSKNLRMLAASEKGFNHSETEDRLKRTMKELGCEKPTEKESLLSYAKEFANKMVSGEISPEKACKEIYLISIELDHPEELNAWLWLDEGHDPVTKEWLWDEYGYAEGNKEKWLEAILREAKKLSETNFS